MSTIEDILKDYDYAETITVPVAEGRINMTVAEAHLQRNPAFARMFWDIGQREGLEKLSDIEEEHEIELFLATCFKSWDVKTKDGEIADPAEIFKTEAGRNLFREIGNVCAKASLFKRAPSKKKPSSTTSPSRSRSAPKSKPSSKGPKPKAKPRRSASKTS